MTEKYEIARPLRRVVAWRILSELTRRHPDLMIIECHGGGGQYDELRLLDPRAENALFSCNIEGRMHFLEAPDVEPLEWETYLAADPREYLHQLEARLQLPAPKALPSTSRPVLTYRVIAQLMAEHVFMPRSPRAWNGLCDTSGYGGGPREEYFRNFPGITMSDRAPLPQDPYNHGEYRFWFLESPDAATIAFETTTARVWLGRRTAEFDLMASYNDVGRDLQSLIAKLRLWIGSTGTKD